MKAHLLRIALALTLALAGSTGMARAGQDFTTPVVTRLEDEGFAVTRIKRTWLGRILIVSQNGEYLREVVINPHTGEILRDKLFALNAANAAASPMGEMQGMPDDMMEEQNSGSNRMSGSMGGSSRGSMGGSSGGSMGGKSGGGMGGGN